MTCLPAHALRDDILIVVNDNSIDSPQVGAYYAEQREIEPANIVHVRVPDSYFISWDDFRRLRDQLISSMQQNTLDDPAQPVACTDGEPPYYCQAAMEQLRTHTRIRYLVTTRGVPTRMTVDGSTLISPNAPTSVDNYLKYWLINYLTNDVQLRFTEREVAFGDGRGMRPVEPAVAVERQGIYGTWYGSSKFFLWRDAATGASIYPPLASSLQGWRYALGPWGEDRPECVDYLNSSGALPEGKAPALCQVQFNDDFDPAVQTIQGITYPAPGNAASREPRVVDALGYQGWLDGQASADSFNALLNWRKDDQCTLTLCENAVDPAACRANSSDSLKELNTDCVGVADGFMGYNHQSYPVSYLAIWPTGWRGPGGGDQDRLAFPVVRTDAGADDNHSLWFRNSDQVADPRCYASSDFTLPPNMPCPDVRQLQLGQSIRFGNTPFDPSNPPTYQISLHYQGLNISQVTPLRVHLLVHETGADATLIDYGFKTLATVAAGATGDHAATFLNRLNGVAFWGSVSHHESGGCAFCFNGLEMLTYFLRGLPLGDAVWFNESHNSGILYGDPLYSPVAVRLNPVNATDTLSGVVDLFGSTVNGRDPAAVTTSYRIDFCPGDDFFVCDQSPQAWQGTGISGSGGTENALLGSVDTTTVPAGTLYLAPECDQRAYGYRSQPDLQRLLPGRGAGHIAVTGRSRA